MPETIVTKQFMVESAVRRAVGTDYTAPVLIAEEFADLVPFLDYGLRSRIAGTIRADLVFDGIPREVDDAWRLAVFSVQKTHRSVGPADQREQVAVSPLMIIRATEYAIGRQTAIVNMTAYELARIADQLDQDTREQLRDIITSRPADPLPVEDRRDWNHALAALTPEYVPF